MHIVRIISVAALAAALVACGPDEAELAANRAAATQVVEDFGARLAHVSKLAEPQEVLNQIRDQYGPYVTTLLLGGWLSDPASAPGREVSSPWPDRIEIRESTPVGSSAFDIIADVVFVTSVDGDPVLRQPVRMRVVRGQDGAWRIAEWNRIDN